MKKTITVVLILVSLFSVFAESSDKQYFKNANPFVSSMEYGIEYALFENPAFLAGRKFQFSIPVSVSAYNAGKILANFNNTGSLKDKALDFIKTAAMNVPVGDYSIIDINVGLFTGFKGFALGFFSSAEVDSMNKGGVITLYPVIDGSLAIGYGRNFGNEKNSFDVGLAIHADYSLVWNKSISTTELSSFSFSKEDLNDIDILGCLTGDIGVSKGFCNDKIKLNVALTNIRLSEVVRYDINTKKYVETSIEYPKNLNLKAGVLFSKNLDGIKSKVALSADVVDILNIEFKTPKSILGHLDLRANANIVKTVKLSAALCGGDAEFGLGIDIFGNEIDAIYKVVEMSEDFGQKTADTLTLRCRIGYDGNR